MPPSMSSQLVGLGFVLGLVQIAKRLNLEDPEKLQYVRMMYVSAQVLNFSILYYIYNLINQKNDQTTFKYEDKKPMSQEPPAEIETTIKDYDIGELKSQLKSSLMGIGILALLHFKFGYVQPLFLQSILPFKNLYETKLVQIYLLGKKAEGDLKRPWIAPSMFDLPQEEQTAEPISQESANAAARHGLPAANITELDEEKKET